MVLGMIEMGSKYHYVFIYVLLLIAIPGTNAVYDYSIRVGTHEVSFNTSSPIWKITQTSPGSTEADYKETYSPTYHNQDFSFSDTRVTSRNDSGPSLDVLVRDFENPLPLWNIHGLEIDTIREFLGEVPIKGKQFYFGGKGFAIEVNGKFCGVIVDWPSDQTEIIITGNLPSYETWQNISDSIRLER
jgi:hypothetical protein